MKIYKLKSFAANMLLIAGVALVACGCKKDDTDQIQVTEGVVFEFVKSTVYGISSLEEIASVKITVKKGNEFIELPSLDVTGNDNLRMTNAAKLPAGTYQVKSYKAYSTSAMQIFEADLDEDNDFVVEPGNVCHFSMPLKVHILISPNYIKNALIGLCLEVFGEDESLWPWDMTEDVGDFDYLEFEYDSQTGAISYLATIVFDSKVFGQMTKLPNALSNLVTLEQLTLVDMANLEELPSNLNEMNLIAVMMVNCPKLKGFPANFFKQPRIESVTMINCNLKEVPAEITEFKNLNFIDMSRNQITKVDAPLSLLPKLNSINFSGNPIESISENVFGPKSKINTMDFSNSNLSTLPSSVATMPLLRGVLLNDCQFSSVPASLIANTGVVSVMFKNNKFTSVKASDFAGMTNLEGIYFGGNTLGTCPKFTNASLLALDVANCGLTAIPDVSALTELRQLFLGGNFSTVPALDLSHNKKFRILSFAGSANLTSLPQEFGFEFTPEGKLEAFAHIDVENCPKLVWTTPKSWNCLDVNGTPPAINPDADDQINPFQGRVTINRKDSPSVQIGK